MVDPFLKAKFFFFFLVLTQEKIYYCCSVTRSRWKFFSPQVIYLLHFWLLQGKSLRNSAEGVGVQGPKRRAHLLVLSYVKNEDDGQVALELRSALFLSFLGTRWAFAVMVVALPRHVINQPRLQEQVSPGQQVVTDEILVGSHCDPIAEAEGRQHIQNLQQDTPQQTPGPVRGAWWAGPDGHSTGRQGPGDGVSTCSESREPHLPTRPGWMMPRRLLPLGEMRLASFLVPFCASLVTHPSKQGTPPVITALFKWVRVWALKIACLGSFSSQVQD